MFSPVTFNARQIFLVIKLSDLQKDNVESKSFGGVNKAYALRAGREVRVIINSNKLDDNKTFIISKDIAKKIQSERFKNESISCNAEMKNKHIYEHCKLDFEAKEIAKKLMNKHKLSGRGYFHSLKVARTIADLNGNKKISTLDIATAIDVRPQFKLA